MENIKFKAEQREKTGGLSSKQSIYNDRKIPGIIYGGKDEPLPILINENDLIRVTSNAGLFNSLVEVEVGDKKEMVVFKEVQKHPSKNVFTHVDLQRVVDGTKINVVVPVVLLNQEKCFGVKIEGGVINHVLKEVSVLADPNNIPESIDVDMEDIKSKEKVRLSMLKTDGAPSVLSMLSLTFSFDLISSISTSIDSGILFGSANTETSFKTWFITPPSILTPKHFS